MNAELNEIRARGRLLTILSKDENVRKEVMRLIAETKKDLENKHQVNLQCARESYYEKGRKEIIKEVDGLIFASNQLGPKTRMIDYEEYLELKEKQK